MQKQQLKNANNITIIDSLKSDCLKIVQAMQEMKEKKEQRYLVLERLTNTVTQIEEEIVQLHKRYERALQQQSERYSWQFDIMCCLILTFMKQQLMSTPS